MKRRALVLTLSILAVAQVPAVPAAAQDGLPPLHRRYDFTRPSGRTALPQAVFEASGLTFTSDGARLLVHGDERGVILVLDPATGGETGRFTVGRAAVENDLEGIAAAGERLFLVSSTGLLYEFREAEPGGSSRFRLTDTRLGDRCEVEGLEHDPVDHVLLAACKTVAPSGPHALVHRVPMAPWNEPLPPLRISLDALEAFGLRARLHPSAVAVHPSGSTLLLLAAREGLLLEVTRDGRLLSAVQLPPARHPQAEGLAVGSDGTLWLVDEGQGRGGAHLTWYAPLPPAGVRDLGEAGR